MGESSFWYRPTRVVPDQRPLNGRCSLRFSGNISPMTGFFLTFYMLIACSNLCKMTKFCSDISNYDKVMPH